tara:strand:- start:1984 stop:2223 length:240 start_codon:yes stop_codon:yes gene_type:complete
MMSNFDYLMGGIIISTIASILNMFLIILIRGKVIQVSKQIDFLYKREVRLKRQQEVYQEKKEKEREIEEIKLRRARAKK